MSRSRRATSIFPSPGERRATGTYYIPEYIVDYIVRQTVVRGLEERRAPLEEKLAGWLDEIAETLRDRKAIARTAAGFLKLLFPDMQPTEEAFRQFCVKPAVELRQRVRDELHKLDPEYARVLIGYA